MELEEGYAILANGYPLQAGDWFEDNCRDEEATACRIADLEPRRISGDGYGDGDGDGVQSNMKLLSNRRKRQVNELERGQLYLFFTGDGWAFIGRFERPCGIFGGVFSDCVNLCRTGGTAWPDLIEGKGRGQATFKTWPKAPAPFTKVLFAFPWTGELPRG